MPRIEDKYLEILIYLYASREDAASSDKQGGSVASLLASSFQTQRICFILPKI